MLDASLGIPRRAKKPSWFGELAIGVLVGIVVAVVLRGFVAQPYHVPSGSMEPTIRTGDMTLAVRVLPAHRGDVVVIRDEHSWIGANERSQTERLLARFGVPFATDSFLLKRIIGMPGDHVVYDHGNLSVNGVEVDEPYAVRHDVSLDVVVPSGHVMLAGDNRPISADSRCRLNNPKVAFVSLDEIVGPAVLYWHNGVWRTPQNDALRNIPLNSTSPDAPQVNQLPEFNC